MPKAWDMQASSYTGPTLADCQRAWDYLVTEYVTDLEIAIKLQTPKEPEYRAHVVVWSPGIEPSTGGPRIHVWGTKDLQHGFEALTYRQLFDLLMVSHRKMMAVMGGQDEMPLP